MDSCRSHSGHTDLPLLAVTQTGREVVTKWWRSWDIWMRPGSILLAPDLCPCPFCRGLSLLVLQNISTSFQCRLKVLFVALTIFCCVQHKMNFDRINTAIADALDSFIVSLKDIEDQITVHFNASYDRSGRPDQSWDVATCKGIRGW